MTRPVGEPGVAWAQFYLEHRRRLNAYAFALTGNAADAQDLLQDVLVRLVAERRAVANACAYVLRCLRNLAIDRRRMRSGKADPLSADVAALIDRDAAVDRELAERVQAALRCLPNEYREVIVLKIYCDLTFGELAEVLGIPAGTVASHYRRGLAELRALLQEVTEDVQ